MTESVEDSVQKEGNRMSGKRGRSTGDIFAALDRKRAELAALEQRAYAERLEEAIAETGILDDIEQIREDYPDVPDVAILAAIGKVMGIRRLTVTQAAPKVRPRRAGPEESGNS